MNGEKPITEAEGAALVERFYTKVRADPEIGPIFNDVVQNWDAHLALPKDFWSTVLLTTGRYKGNPLLAHFCLPIEERYFARWLTLFSPPHEEIPSLRRFLRLLCYKSCPSALSDATTCLRVEQSASIIRADCSGGYQ
jgi:hemoglobin